MQPHLNHLNTNFTNSTSYKNNPTSYRNNPTGYKNPITSEFSFDLDDIEFPADEKYLDELEWKEYVKSTTKYPNSYKKLSYRAYWKPEICRDFLYHFRWAFAFCEDMTEIAQQNYSYFDSSLNKTVYYDFTPDMTFPLSFLIPSPHYSEPANSIVKAMSYIDKATEDNKRKKALEHLQKDPKWYPKEWIFDEKLLDKFTQEGYLIYERQIRNPLLVWLKTFEYLKRHHFQVNSWVLTFPTLEKFIDFMQSRSLSYFLETLKKTLLSFAKKHKPDKKLPHKVYYLAYYEFHDNGVPHIHILTATNFKFPVEDVSINPTIKNQWEFGRYDYRKLFNIRINYALKYSQKPPVLYGMLKYLLQQVLNIQKVHFLYVSRDLKKDFPAQFKKAKLIKSFYILKTIALYAKDISKPSKHSYIFHFNDNFTISLKNVFDFLPTQKAPSYRYSVVSLNHPGFKNPIIYYTRSKKQLIHLLNLLVSKINSFKNKEMKHNPYQLHLFVKDVHESVCHKVFHIPVFHIPVHFNHVLDRFSSKLSKSIHKLQKSKHNSQSKSQSKCTNTSTILEHMKIQHSYTIQKLSFLTEIGIERIKNLLQSAYNSNLKYRKVFQKDYVGYVGLIPETITKLEKLKELLTA